MRCSALLLTLLMACAPRPARPRACPDAEGPHCFLFSPADTGKQGQSADVDHLAVRGSKPQLVVFLNGSGAAPGNGAELLKAARDLGLYAIALSYRSGESVGALCRGVDACFEPTRASLITGALEVGAATGLRDLESDEGIEPRLLAALQFVATLDADGDWLQFVDADGAVGWASVIVSGHSQGGGHAALLAKRHPVARVLMLASPCDARADGTPASWLSDASGWATPPSRMFGLWAAGDTVCPSAPASWAALGIAGQDTSGACADSTPHGAPLTCPSNVAKWKAVLAP